MSMEDQPTVSIEQQELILLLCRPRVKPKHAQGRTTKNVHSKTVPVYRLFCYLVRLFAQYPSTSNFQASQAASKPYEGSHGGLLLFQILTG